MTTMSGFGGMVENNGVGSENGKRGIENNECVQFFQ